MRKGPDSHRNPLRSGRFPKLSLCTVLIGWAALLSGCGAQDAVSENPNAVQVVDDTNVNPYPKGDPNTPPPPPIMCVHDKAGGPMVCQDAAAWKAEAAKLCSSKNLLLTGVSLSGGCGHGGYHEAAFDCCAPPSPPPPMNCIKETQTARMCQDGAAWKTAGANFCASKKLTLTNLSLESPCRMGALTYSQATFECCGAPPPPPPPPPGMCIWLGEGGPNMMCLDEAGWKAIGTRACAAKMLTLRSVSLAGPCRGAPNSYSAAKFECCGGQPPPPMCTDEKAGGAMTCKDATTWTAEASRACEAKKLSLSRITLSSRCGPNSFREASYQCCAPNPPPPPPMCMSETVRSTACHDAATWKVTGENFCASKKLTLTNVSLGGPCMTGAATYSQATFECCGTPNPPPPPPPPPPGKCIWLDGGANGMCLDEGNWKALGARLCASKMLTLHNMSLAGPCMGAPHSYSAAKFECCGGSPPPPPPPMMCISQMEGGRTCKDAGTWKMEGAAFCAAKKMVLVGVSLSGSCGMGGYLGAKFDCCAQNTPPPPPPPMNCIEETQIVQACQDAGAWKTAGANFCASKMRHLTNLTLGGPCTAGGVIYRQATFDCCL